MEQNKKANYKVNMYEVRESEIIKIRSMCC